jgi:hypothetical protein
VRDRPTRFAHLWKTADVGSVFRFSGALDGPIHWRVRSIGVGSIGRTWRSRIPSALTVCCKLDSPKLSTMMSLWCGAMTAMG